MRPDIHKYFTDMVRLVASRSTCVRRSVGCVLVDSKNRVLATGYNGVASGDDHCNDIVTSVDGQVLDPRVVFPKACKGANAKSGQNLDQCRAVHAEQNAILQCNDVDRVHRAYVSTFPCPSCTKLLMNTGCREIVYLDAYGDSAGYDMWVKAGRIGWKFEGEPHMIQRDLVRLFDDDLNEWRVVVACVCLNLASARVARGIVMRILDRWPTPGALSDAPVVDVEAVLGPLGLAKRRASYLHGISTQWGIVDIACLPGVGPYALESVMVFCRNKAPRECTDRKVAAWVEWARRNPSEV